MKHITKVANLQNLPNARPIIAMDPNNKMKWEGMFVDLGLPSGLKWGKCNLGAHSETEYGNYYMWGYTEQNEGWPIDKNSHPYSWSEYTKFTTGTYAWRTNEKVFTKYCQTSQEEKYWDGDGPADNKLVLDTGINGDDPANKYGRTTHRMPTIEEFEELKNETDHEWVENFNGSGVNGHIFMKKSDHNVYVFFPANGSCNDNSIGGIGEGGMYWSSSLNVGEPTELNPRTPNTAQHIVFLADNDDIVTIWYGDRCNGLAIRPVTK